VDPSLGVENGMRRRRDGTGQDLPPPPSRIAAAGRSRLSFVVHGAVVATEREHVEQPARVKQRLRPRGNLSAEVEPPRGPGGKCGGEGGRSRGTNGRCLHSSLGRAAEDSDAVAVREADERRAARKLAAERAPRRLEGAAVLAEHPERIVVPEAQHYEGSRVLRDGDSAFVRRKR